MRYQKPVAEWAGSRIRDPTTAHLNHGRMHSFPCQETLAFASSFYACLPAYLRLHEQPSTLCMHAHHGYPHPITSDLGELHTHRPVLRLYATRCCHPRRRPGNCTHSSRSREALLTLLAPPVFFSFPRAPALRPRSSDP